MKLRTNLEMASPEMLDEKLCDIRGMSIRFKITAGPLVLGGEKFDETYVLKINNESYSGHLNSLGGMSFGSMLFADYIEKARHLAKQFCDERGFVINNVSYECPDEYVAVVARKQEE